MLRAFVFAAVVVAVGLLGAAAFNPDDGLVAESDVLWRMFGISAYVGLVAVYVIPALALGRLVLGVAGRVGRRA